MLERGEVCEDKHLTFWAKCFPSCQIAIHHCHTVKELIISGGFYIFHMRPAYYTIDTKQHTGEIVPGVIFLHHFWGSHIIFLNKLKQLVSDGVLKYIKLISF